MYVCSYIPFGVCIYQYLFIYTYTIFDFEKNHILIYLQILAVQKNMHNLSSLFHLINNYL